MKLNRIVNTKDMPHEQWLAYRRNGIGGSDAGAICGLNPYTTAIDVYLDKLDLKDEVVDNESMRQGRDLEQYVAERFCEATGKKVRKENAILGNDRYPFAYANVDRLIVGENAGLECKTANAYSADKWKDEKIPEHYELQCHHYMMITGATHWYIACVILGKGFVWHKIDRDDDTIAMLADIEKEFWNCVQNKKMPEPDGSKACDEIIAKYYKDTDPDKRIELDMFADKLARRAEIKELEVKLETERKQIEQEIKTEMKDAEVADIAGAYKVTWKSLTRNTIDSKRLKEEQPYIYQSYLKSSTSRRFEIKEIVQEKENV